MLSQISLYRLGIVLLALLLNACPLQTLPHKPDAAPQAEAPTLASPQAQQHQQQLQGLQQYYLHGRIAVQYQGRGYQGQIQWHQQDNQLALTFIGPLGNTLATIHISPEHAMLTQSDGKTLHAQDIQSLSQQALGWPIPPWLLSDWIVGRPSAAPITSSSVYASGELAQLQQDQWTIEYSQYQRYPHDGNSIALPVKLHCRHPSLSLRLVLDEWQLDTKPMNADHE